uniref:Magnesium transporter n=1 Tax=Attheya septentrionalis TaxID=420275 RepID=A0A7S2XT73_9STRA|mmetsp:Transcript_7175/g.12871  ORF Transcript_7175/g.12871 Transcript_7175/m.12871 type:complete len:565 (+) Transcript_7175:175-1869(+)
MYRMSCIGSRLSKPATSLTSHGIRQTARRNLGSEPLRYRANAEYVLLSSSHCDEIFLGRRTENYRYQSRQCFSTNGKGKTKAVLTEAYEYVGDENSDDDEKKETTPGASYLVARITSDGRLKMKSWKISDILKGSTVHARDLFALDLTRRYDRQTTQSMTRLHPCAILPRGKEIIMSFGNIRAVIGRERAMLFDAHTPGTQILARQLADTFNRKMKYALEYGDGENLSVDHKYRLKSPYLGDPFELVFIEEVLCEVCSSFNRRIRLYEPIVDSLLSRVSNEVLSESGVHRLVPVKDSLQEFEMVVKQAVECLSHLLHSDEDMVELMLTEKIHAQRDGIEVDVDKHTHVELLLEEYARQLNDILQEINFLLRRVQSKQELVSISLDAYRNRMIRMNVYVSIVGMGLAVSTTVAGYFGMNLINGLEQSPTAFSSVVVATIVGSIFLTAACTSYLSGARMRQRAIQRLDEIETLTSALSDMNSLDYVAKCMVESGRPMGKQEFKGKLVATRSSGEVPDKEVDFLFDVLDISHNGKLYTEDFRSIENFSQRLRLKKNADSHRDDLRED